MEVTEYVGQPFKQVVTSADGMQDWLRMTVHLKGVKVEPLHEKFFVVQHYGCSQLADKDV